MQQRQLCSECKTPVCTYCYKYLNSLSPSLPQAALSNDMMVFYAPEELYQDGGLTIMEMLCASPCLTAMICFSMEVKYGNMLNSHALMQRHRVGARGNATTFLLPWESILLELERLEEAAAKNNAGPTLPRTGEDIKHVVQVLLKSSDEDKRDDLKHFIHQAHVNRQKVLNCILGMKRRGHRAYMHVDEADARRRAEKLPEHGVPPELISLLPDDSSYDKLKIQKAATPVEGMKTTLIKKA